MSLMLVHHIAPLLVPVVHTCLLVHVLDIGLGFEGFHYFCWCFDQFQNINWKSDMVKMHVGCIISVLFELNLVILSVNFT
jgi:hypothetical protein